jgi:hypothetical protein
MRNTSILGPWNRTNKARLLAIVFACSSFLLSGAARHKTVPAINEVEEYQQVGQHPYELTWVEREQDPNTVVDFEDLTGWTLELFDGAKGKLSHSREQQMWGEYVAKFDFSGTHAKSRVIARPPKPVPIPGRFDSIDLWGYGYRWSWVKDETSPPVDVSVLLTDANAKEIQIQIASVVWKQWWLIHRRIPADVLRQIAFPASVSGIEISKIRNTSPRYFYCDSLAFYTEQLKPLEFKPQPKRNLAAYRGQIQGLNTGPGSLPFPTREETILPTNRQRFEVLARQPSPGRFELEYKGADAAVKYEYSPRSGNLGEITARVNGSAAFRPLDGGGVRFDGTPAQGPAEGQLVSASLADGVVSARFRYGIRIVDYALRLWQKSLVLEVWCEGGEAAELSFGHVTGVTNPNLITVPYITYGSTNPRVLMSGDAAKRVFTSVWFDWYRTNASEPYSSKDPEVTADTALVNGGLRYKAKTDGRRNDLYERIFITTSPTYEETLPTIANPPSLRQREGQQVIWTVTAPESFQKDHERCREIRSYGMDKIMQHSHEVTWRDEADSFTMRLHAAPQKGGDATLQWYVGAQNDLGWLQGVYTNYTDFCPTNTNWSPDHVQRRPDGEWRRAWPRNYALKPAKSVEMDDYYAQRIHEKYGTKMSYTDVHTANPPWEYCDYDARVPGAGTMAATFYAYGQLLLNDQRVYGPTQSEGTYQWLYAGLESGSYGWAYTKWNLLTEPVDVAFQLTKIHLLDCTYGMGDTNYYLEQIDPNWSKSAKRREYLDLSLATTIAYGNMGWLATEFEDRPFHWEAMARSYYMMQQLQQQYAFVQPARIEYADAGGAMLTASQAHSTGAIAASRLHVEYENGTHVYVNRGAQGDWTVPDAGGQKVELPPSGWLAYNQKNDFHEISAKVAGRRIDYVNAREFEFLDGRGEWTEMGRLAAAGSVARRQQPGGEVEFIDIYGNSRIGFQESRSGALAAFSGDGRALGQVELRSPRAGWYEFTPLDQGRTYVFSPGK